MRRRAFHSACVFHWAPKSEKFPPVLQVKWAPGCLRAEQIVCDLSPWLVNAARCHYPSPHQIESRDRIESRAGNDCVGLEQISGGGGGRAQLCNRVKTMASRPALNASTST
ncbi:hypothetical protein CDAR_586831 [Caerostris darwini]|uniref:Uncharacterized protein n=1 Tax=Caerostris darwini TaxID=1538125 RepID=A0AAV4SVQ0_9ARAC|nr:hypothetical protein CDAR_586831 [Caerostris darwini]